MYLQERFGKNLTLALITGLSMAFLFTGCASVKGEGGQMPEAAPGKAEMPEEISIAEWSFNGETQGWSIAADSGQKTTAEASTTAGGSLAIPVKWESGKEKDPWGSAPRVQLQNAALSLPSQGSIAFDLLLDPKLMENDTIEISPVFQYPPSWWAQMDTVYLSDIAPENADGSLVRYRMRAPFTTPEDSALGHIVLVIVGAGSGYEGTLYLDNISINSAD